MRDIDLTPKLREKMKSRPRVRGRYNSSELYFINKGDVTPQQWFEQKDKEVHEMLRMWNGTGAHNQIEELLGSEHSEKKCEYKYRDIILVGKSDYLPPNRPDEVWEFKTSEKKMTSSKPWHDHQVKLYCTMFEKKNGLVYQPVKNDSGVYLKHIGTVERDDAWFQKELEKLYVFHQRVEHLWNQGGAYF